MAKKRQESVEKSLKRLARTNPKRIVLILVVLLFGWGMARLTGQEFSFTETLETLLGEQPAVTQTVQAPAPQAAAQPKKGEKLAGIVTRVVDGDTIVVDVDGQSRRVRLLGVDTPETVHPNKEVQFYGPEASAFTKKELTGKRVWLEYDAAPLDRYQRHLAYVWLEYPGEGEAAVRQKMFNARLLLGGYAKVMTIQPNSRYSKLFARLQEEARKAGRGLWAKEQ